MLKCRDLTDEKLLCKGRKDMYIIAGLGNPTKTYEGTRHNIGFDMIDAIADKYNIDVTTKKHKALTGKGRIDGVPVILAKPQTYMNLSGESIRDIADFYKIPAENIIIIYDDISLEVGQLRIRKKGSAGGHNGIKNIIAHLGTEVFPRIKVGVGEKPKGWDLADYVLSKYSKAERECLRDAQQDVVGAAALMVHDDVDGAMNQYNGKKRDIG